MDIPVHYGGELGEDLYDVAEFHHTNRKRDYSASHSAYLYGLYDGFSTRLSLLGWFTENLHTPRKKTPRTKVPAGAVGIGSQTGIYPFTSPGGWQLLGKPI